MSEQEQTTPEETTVAAESADSQETSPVEEAQASVTEETAPQPDSDSAAEPAAATASEPQAAAPAPRREERVRPPRPSFRGGREGRRQGSWGSRSREADAEDQADVEMKRRIPAQYKPRMGPTQSRFRPRFTMTDVDLADVDYKNITVLMQFIDGQGRILSRRKTRVSAKMQRRLKTAIKQARHLALLPYTPSHVRGTRQR